MPGAGAPAVPTSGGFHGARPNGGGGGGGGGGAGAAGAGASGGAGGGAADGAGADAEDALSKAWDVYYSVFRRINKQLPSERAANLFFHPPPCTLSLTRAKKKMTARIVLV